MIDWIKSAELNNCTVEWLKSYFERFPSSHKKVWRICEGEGCDDKRVVIFQQCRSLCHLCSTRTSEARKAASLSGIKRFSDQEVRDEMSETLLQWNKEHPEAGKLHSEWLIRWHKEHPEIGEAQSKRVIERFSDQLECDAQSERIKNSEAAQIEHERQRGGNDIVDHHIAYDFGRPKALTVKITRKFHSWIHHPLGLKFRGYSPID